ncbi:uncharacterized protein LOC117803698 [Ailuropoda melanoleuca]|nr:uncharacterized protein LOC117803698 [Ailuropoda melanoleuca]
MRAEVGLLTRNIVVMGEMEDSCYPYSSHICSFFDFDTFGGHIKFALGFKAAHLEGVELKHMGQQLVGQYPIHFHLAGDVDEKGGYDPPTYVRELSIHHTFSRCVTVHGSNGLLVSTSFLGKQRARPRVPFLQTLVLDGGLHRTFSLGPSGVEPSLTWSLEWCQLRAGLQLIEERGNRAEVCPCQRAPSHGGGELAVATGTLVPSVPLWSDGWSEGLSEAVWQDSPASADKGLVLRLHHGLCPTDLQGPHGALSPVAASVLQSRQCWEEWLPWQGGECARALCGFTQPAFTLN